jgi:hypothetical protein
MRDNLWETVARVASALGKGGRWTAPKVGLRPAAFARLAARQRALAAEIARLAAAARLAGRHDE